MWSCTRNLLILLTLPWLLAACAGLPAAWHFTTGWGDCGNWGVLCVDAAFDNTGAL